MTTVEQWKAEYAEDKRRLVAQKACTRFDTLAFLANDGQKLGHFFNTRVRSGMCL